MAAALLACGDGGVQTPPSPSVSSTTEAGTSVTTAASASTETTAGPGPATTAGTGTTAGSGTTATAGSGVTAGTGTSASAGTSRPPAAPPPLLYFAVEGGFANLARSLTVARDGSAVAELNGQRSARQIDAATRQAIVAELERSKLFDRDRTYPAQGADLQRYEIRYAGATVVAYDTSVPDPLSRAVELLEAALRS